MTSPYDLDSKRLPLGTYGGFVETQTEYYTIDRISWFIMKKIRHEMCEKYNELNEYIEFDLGIEEDEGKSKDPNERWQPNKSLFLDYTRTAHGGWRLWLLCKHCHRRVTVLYKMHGNIACRHCHNLRYMCQYYRNVWAKMIRLNRRSEMAMDRIERPTHRLIYAGKPTRYCRTALKHMGHVYEVRKLLDEVKAKNEAEDVTSEDTTTPTSAPKYVPHLDKLNVTPTPR